MIFWLLLLCDSIFGFFILAHIILQAFSSWSIKAVKELYQRRLEKKIGGQEFFLYFDFISGFNNHTVGEEIIPESKWNGYVSQGRC